ncbi:uncharacterized protein FOMMEDRAFT_108878 [Fomitiporia mediterranea MF3/22]|uniref:uncharacterized protein n=1 Tax=Fomitiporia mediterranea (strain MF3/22) TaxID=694068 RepID=UPI00044079A9|nr:uncharacterized protein FOMMEDRAFT_108878 [Fomitiporia mediterranea MF3/22]EJD01876.1 hypothetical protein FOMMEDRAFT_108878 [Fomitiporia mediterranea MF3/22]
MPYKDVDPLADTISPRYAYESDDEDETGLADVDLSSGTNIAPDVPAVEITFLPDEKKQEEYGNILIVASGVVGAVWARGAHLGEQVGQVNVNKRAVGLVFQPSWTSQGTKGTVLVSEAFVRLPVWAMNAYAAAVLERYKPSKVILLDAYSTATYISLIPIAHHEAPLRYLSTDRTPPSSKAPLSLFTPPNLLQSTTAAFLNLLALPNIPSQSQKSKFGLGILVPSRRAPLPTPRSLSREDEADTETSAILSLAALASIEDSEDWDPALLKAAHSAVFEAAGLGTSSAEWTDSRSSERKGEGVKASPKRRRFIETEGGMYI